MKPSARERGRSVFRTFVNGGVCGWGNPDSSCSRPLGALATGGGCNEMAEYVVGETLIPLPKAKFLIQKQIIGK
jgi:hypothetical protein